MTYTLKWKIYSKKYALDFILCLIIKTQKTRITYKLKRRADFNEKPLQMHGFGWKFSANVLGEPS
jgi:hypothetical protein